MCNICNIKKSTTVGSVVKIVRKCKVRSERDKGRHLAEKQALVYITQLASRGEGFYGQVINLNKNKLQKTNAHFRGCEFDSTEYKWNNDDTPSLFN